MYFPPTTTFDPLFSSSNDCTFGGTAGTAVCAVSSTANYVYMTFKSSASYAITNPNAFPQSTNFWIYIKNIRFPQASTAKYPFAIYMRLFNSSAVNPTTYITVASASVLPRSGTLSGISLT
jgi:hypothetical protein